MTVKVKKKNTDKIQVVDDKELYKQLEPLTSDYRKKIMSEVQRWHGHETMPVLWGLYCPDTVVFCRKCKMVLPFAWDEVETPCFCGKPDPAIMASYSGLLPEEIRKSLSEKCKRR